jgi:lipoyl-dependent peroxiredoxin
MAAEHNAHASWQGDLMSGSGTVSTGSGAVSGVPLTWKARAEDASAGSSPEELIAAAHAACFAMALSHGLVEGGYIAERLETSATVTFQPGEGIQGSALTVRGTVAGISEQEFLEAAEEAKDNCPVSQALSVPITLDATFAG